MRTGVTRTGKTIAVVAAALVLLLLMGYLAVLGPEVAQAVPPGDSLESKAQEAARVSREIEDLDKELAVYTESYNRLQGELDEITEKVDNTRKRLWEVKKNLKEKKQVLNKRAVAMYKKGRVGTLEVLLNTTSLTDFFDRADFVMRVADSDSKLISRIKVTKDSISKVEQDLAEEQRRQRGLVNQVSAKKTMIEATLSERQRILDGLNQEIAEILEQQRQESVAESEELAREVEEELAGDPDAPATTDIARTALQYLGVPYHYAGDGPGRCPTGEHEICFDCSGFTQYVYSLHGMTIPHNSMMQFNACIHVPKSQAEPGDLVFFGMPPHHVGIYLGGDKYVHAPHTGDVVKVSRLSNRGDTSGFGRFRKK